jgi:hypothetical protein
MTPTTVQNALLPAPLVLGGLTLQPVTLGAYLFLEKINSPLLASPPPEKLTAMELFRVVYVLTQPLPDCVATWVQGAEAFDAAVIGFASQIPLTDLDALAGQLIQYLGAAFAPAAKLHPNPSSEGDGIPLSPGAQPTATGSAGS